MTFSKSNDFKTEKQWVADLKQSDTRAFQCLYDRYYEPLYRFLWYRLFSEEQVRDLLQDVFTRLWMNRRSLNPDLSIKAYLYRIANNLLIDSYRRQESEKAYVRDVRHNEEQNPDSTYQSRLDLETFIASLPEALRTVFLLSKWEGFRYSEIAEILNVSPKTVEARMGKAMKAIKDRFAAYE